MNKYVNKWVVGGKLWSEYSDSAYIDMNFDKRDLVHSDDHHLIQNHMFIGLCYCIDKTDDDFYILFNDKFTIRVKESAIINILPKSSSFFWKDIVQEIERPNINGIIEKIEWHYKCQHFMYYIKINEKLKGRRYNENELKKIE